MLTLRTYLRRILILNVLIRKKTLFNVERFTESKQVIRNPNGCISGLEVNQTVIYEILA